LRLCVKFFASEFHSCRVCYQVAIQYTKKTFILTGMKGIQGITANMDKNFRSLGKSKDVIMSFVVFKGFIPFIPFIPVKMPLSLSLRLSKRTISSLNKSF
jgi:hypothetical protein